MVVAWTNKCKIGRRNDLSLTADSRWCISRIPVSFPNLPVYPIGAGPSRRFVFIGVWPRRYPRGFVLKGAVCLKFIRFMMHGS